MVSPMFLQKYAGKHLIANFYKTNGGCMKSYNYAPCGRGNTKYSENLGLTAITITGQFRVR